MNGTQQTRSFGISRAFNCNASDACSFTQIDREADIDQLMVIVDLNLRMYRCSEITIASEEFLKPFLRNRKTGWIIRIFIAKVGNLQQSGKGELLDPSGKIDHAQVISWLE